MTEQTSGRLYSPLTRSSTESKIPRLGTPPSSRPSSGEFQDQGQINGYNSRFGWSSLEKRTSLPPVESEEDEERQSTVFLSSSKIPAPSFGNISRRQIPVRPPSIREVRERMQAATAEEAEHKISHRRAATEYHEPIPRGKLRIITEPVEVSTTPEVEIETGKQSYVVHALQSTDFQHRERDGISCDEDTHPNSETCTTTC